MESLTRVNKDGVSYFKCQALEDAGFLNAFSTRLGGVSPLPQNDLNLTYKEDIKDNVDENRKRFLSAVDAKGMSLATGHQTHSSECAILWDVPAIEPDADALLTNEKNILMGVKTADCLAVLIADPKTGAMAAVHAGWKGTLGRITQRAMQELKEKFRAKPETCLAAFGPSACVDCYEVKADVAQLFDNIFLKKKGDKTFLDVPRANYNQLTNEGVRSENIYQTEYCTIHQNDLFFSHRKEGHRGPGKVGRLLGTIGKQ